MKYIITILSIALLFACKSKTTSDESAGAVTSSELSTYSSSSSETSTSEAEEKYEDGTYCADVEYYNPNTGTRNTYELSVEVEDGEVTVINWPNGGWLDDSHFTPEELDENGEASFVSDKGYYYDVTITSSSPCRYSSARLQTIETDMEENEMDKYGDETGTVIWEQSGCRYIIIESGGWYVVAENDGLSRGDRLRGKLRTYGSEDIYNLSGSTEISLYIDNYYGSKSRAMERVNEKCDLVNEVDDY